MMMCSSRYKIVYDYLILSFYAVNTVFMRIKYQFAGRAVCAYTHDFQKLPGFAFIGACVVIRMNIVCPVDSKILQFSYF